MVGSISRVVTFRLVVRSTQLGAKGGSAQDTAKWFILSTHYERD